MTLFVNDGILMTVYFLFSLKYTLNAHGEINIFVSIVSGQMISFLILVFVISGHMFIVSTLCRHTFVAILPIHQALEWVL